MVVHGNFAKNNANIYFTELLTRLNKYEGESRYFNLLNEKFINFLQTLFLVCNVEASNQEYKKILQDKAFKSHPFLPLIIRLLHKSRINEQLRKSALQNLRAYPQYPLYDFIEYALSVSKKPGEMPISHDPLIIYLHKDMALAQFTHNAETLVKLANAGFTFASLALVEKEIANKDYDAALARLDIAALQSNINRNAFLITQYIRLAQSLTLLHPFGLVLATKSIEMKDYTLLHNLLDHYENSINKNEALLVYYLAIGVHNDDKIAIKKLEEFYNDNEALALFLKTKN